MSCLHNTIVFTCDDLRMYLCELVHSILLSTHVTGNVVTSFLLGQGDSCCSENVCVCVFHCFSAQSGTSVEREKEKVTHVAKDIVRTDRVTQSLCE